MRDFEIVERILQGDRNEFRHITKMCNQPLYRVAIAFMKNRADAEDAIQSAYLKAFVHLHTFRQQSTFLTWITRILINECKMVIRSRSRVVTTEQEDSVEVQNRLTNEENVMDSIYRKEVGEVIEQGIQRLPEKYRVVYVLREVNEFSTEEAAEALGLSEENIKVRLHRAKTMLRDDIIHRIPATELFPYGNEHCQQLTEKVMYAIQSLPIVEWS